MKNFNFSLILLLSNCAIAGGNWSSVTVFNQEPLEVKLVTYTDAMDSDLLTMVLWNDGSMNRLDAIRVPPPYDGTNVTSTSLENTNILFSLGDACRMGGNIVVPYVKNFNVEIALYNGMNMSWSKMTIPETVIDDFDSADCAVSQDGIFVTGHNLDDSSIEIFKFNSNPSTFSPYGEFGGGGNNIAGPFDGGVRDTLVSQRDGPFSMSLYQRSDGMIRTVNFNTSDVPPVFTHNNVTPEAAPIGFTFVRESFGSRLNDRTIFGYNANSRAELIEVLDANPLFPQTTDLGPIDNTGTQLSFQGGAYFAKLDGNGGVVENSVLWDKYYDQNPVSGQVEIDATYPLNGVGGPVATCLREHSAFEIELYVAGPKVGSDGTDLYKKDIESLDVIFQDGFESGDVSAWSTCP